LSTQLKADDVVIDVHLAGRKLDISATRGGSKLAPRTLALPAGDAPCKAPDGYSLENTTSGYDPATHRFAFSISVLQGQVACTSHGFVVALE
jgi:hypothetical protein